MPPRRLCGPRMRNLGWAREGGTYQQQVIGKVNLGDRVVAHFGW